MSVARFLRTVNNRQALFAFVCASVIVAILCSVFDPRWDINDDVAMSMIAHGYGLTAYGSPNLVFSNVIWGYLVRAIPAINGVLGYSLATVAVLLAIGWAMLYFLLRLGAGYFISLLAVALIISRPILFPQFTVNAGLLTVTAVMGWQAYARSGRAGLLVLACLLAFTGYLIRATEFILVLGVALPLLPWHTLKERRQMRIAFLFLGFAIVSAEAFDRWSYDGSEWEPFFELNAVRKPYTDYQAGEYLKQHPDIMDRHGYSVNDVNLFRDWFLVDPGIADVRALKSMLDELGSFMAPADQGIRSGFQAISALWAVILLPMLLAATLLLLLFPGRHAVAAWVLCMGALFTIGWAGRPGMFRVYIPLLSLLLVAPLMVNALRSEIQGRIARLILALAFLGNAYVLVPQATQSRQWIHQIKSELHALPEGPVVVWGYSFPFELAFPVLDRDVSFRKTVLVGLDSFTHAPFSVARAEEEAGRGVIQRLRAPEGMTIVVHDYFLNELSMYCMEHLNGRLQGAKKGSQLLPVWNVRCVGSEGS